MKNLSRTVKLLLPFAIALAGIFALQACMNSLPQVGSDAPYVVDFEFQAPVAIANADEGALKAALNKYAVPRASRIKIDGKDFWPPLSSIKTDRVATTGRTEVGAAFIVRGKSTQRLGFKTAADMQAFMREISKR